MWWDFYILSIFPDYEMICDELFTQKVRADTEYDDIDVVFHVVCLPSGPCLASKSHHIPSFLNHFLLLSLLKRDSTHRKPSPSSLAGVSFLPVLCRRLSIGTGLGFDVGIFCTSQLKRRVSWMGSQNYELWHCEFRYVRFDKKFDIFTKYPENDFSCGCFEFHDAFVAKCEICSRFKYTHFYCAN